ncbi:DarT ssDNA thymidine ADP-ribosyltransferase family protein, partial [Marivirga sp.]|uniref:DarT ssDNA thymidine ADP-ribosyltransferase family protein n=1 Tax=Marivirga sp. TaxID=2018662 RepID=UPI0025EF17C2
MELRSIIEPVKIRLRSFKTLFRRALPLEKHESAILGLIHSNNGEYGYKGLGSLLGFAMQEDAGKSIRKDTAEIQLFDSYLENLKSNHLIQYDTQSIELTYWGQKAIRDRVKYTFYSCNIQVPEFFDIYISGESTLFPFKEIGVEVRISNEKIQEKAWEMENLEVPDQQILNQFDQNRFNINDKIIFDSIEPTSNIQQIDTDLEFREVNSSISVLYDGEFQEKLSIEINHELNYGKAEALKLKLRYATFIESNQSFSVEDLNEFISIIDWNEILENCNINWNQNSIKILEEYGVNWNIISSKCPLNIVIESIDQYQDFFDWSELTKRVGLSFILSNINNYPWDADGLIDIVTLDDFKANISSITQLQVIDFNKFYEELEYEFVIQNFRKLPGIEDYLTKNNSENLCDFIIKYPDGNWNSSWVSQYLNIENIENRFDELKNVLNFEIVVERIISSHHSFNDSVFQQVIVEANFSSNVKLINKNTKCSLNLFKLLALEGKGIIYWGSEIVPGFEQNAFQNWSIDIIEYFKGKWNYPDAIQVLGNTISDYSILKSFEYEWDFKSISENRKLINQPGFFDEFKNQIDIDSAVLLFDKDSLESNLISLIQINQVDEIENLPKAISNLFNLENIFQKIDKYQDFYLKIADKVQWNKVWNRTEKQFVQNNIEELFSMLDSIAYPKYLIAEITNYFEVEEIFELSDLEWDWNNVTERAIEQEIINDNNLVAFSCFWDWELLIEKYFEPEDLLIEGKLSELAALISQASQEIREKSWRLITELYPAHSLWSAINVTSDIELFQWDWNYISSSNKISLDLNTLKSYKKVINWSLLSSNSFLNAFFRNDKEIYHSRKQWENHVLSYLSEFVEFWIFQELSKLDNITRSETIVSYFKLKWDWDILSSGKSKLLTQKRKNGVVFNGRLLEKFQRFINFQIFSQRNDAVIDFDLIKRFEAKNWDWQGLSSNPNLKIEKETLFTDLIDKPWDWTVLCKNPNIKFTNDDLIQLQDKNLNWPYLSTKEWLANSTIVQLSDKNWDWCTISSSESLIFDENLLRVLSDKADVSWVEVLNSDNLHCNDKTVKSLAKSINSDSSLWRNLSGNKNLLFENNSLLEDYKEFWDWNVLIEKRKIDINSLLTLRRYQDYIDWSVLSTTIQFAPEKSILSEFKHLLNWKYLTPKIPLKEDMLNSFKLYIDWNVLCRKSNFDGQLSLVKNFIDFIDFGTIENNSTIDYETKNFIENYLIENVHARFVYELKKQRSPWSGYVYHFTHLTNAVEIINKRQIVSRNKALKATKFSDAAGSVVNRRDDAHEYARFYFRPQTPTQFYNECLGKDHESGRYGWAKDYYGNWQEKWKSDFPKALDLGLPKCPIPVFFKFDLREILYFQSNRCFVSNGNLQTNWAQIGSLSEMYNRFDFDDLYSTIKTTSDGDWRTYMNKSQQEFLVKDEFDFSNINNYEILVRNNSDLAQLRHHLKGQPEIISKTRVADYNDDIYLNSNKSIDYQLEGNSINISTNYSGNGTRSAYFEIDLKDDSYKIKSGHLLSKTGNKLRFFPDINIEFESEPCLTVTFQDQVTDKEPWQIIKYCSPKEEIQKSHSENNKRNEIMYPQSIEELCDVLPQYITTYDSKVRHYILRDHTNIVLNQFDRYFSNKFNDKERELIRFFLIIHDIGKPQAFNEGNKGLQYDHSIQTVKNIWFKISNSQEDLTKVLLLLEGDYIGEYFQNKNCLESISQVIINGSKRLNTPPVSYTHLTLP